MKETPSANKIPPKDDPRIDALIRGYAHLSEQVEVLTEQVKIQKHQVDDLTVDAILAEFHQNRNGKLTQIPQRHMGAHHRNQPKKRKHQNICSRRNRTANGRG
ncbi:MAG: hypothetical protein ACLRNW_28440 [Neglectibacter sp.]